VCCDCFSALVVLRYREEFDCPEVSEVSVIVLHAELIQVSRRPSHLPSTLPCCRWLAPEYADSRTAVHQSTRTVAQHVVCCIVRPVLACPTSALVSPLCHSGDQYWSHSRYLLWVPPSLSSSGRVSRGGGYTLLLQRHRSEVVVL
jgi:hypothetical protein